MYVCINIQGKPLKWDYSNNFIVFSVMDKLLLFSTKEAIIGQ